MSKNEVKGQQTTASKVPPVPESILRRRKISEVKRAEEAKQRLEQKKKNRNNRRVIFKKAESYVREYRAQEKNILKLKRAARAEGNFYVAPECKVAIVVRIRGINQIHPRSKKILQLLRLRQLNNAVFVRLNKATLQMLKIVEPYIAWGYPNLKTVRELIYKRGFAKINGNRVPILDNSVIESRLGNKGIICIEDLIHEIFTAGANFPAANRFLWPFKLNPPRGGFRSITNHFISGGDFGNRENQINQFVQSMN